MSSATPNKETEVDVLVIGAGPAGVFATNALAKAGVKVKIIDRKPEKITCGHADGLQPRTLEVLQSYGLLEKLLKEGNQMHMAAFYNPNPNGGIQFAGRGPDSTAMTARYPFEVTYHQGAVESVFIDSMVEQGVTVDRPYAPISIELSQDERQLKDPNAHPVKVVLKNLDPPAGQPDTETVHAKFVIGADGAHSWVRRALGIVMEGEQTDLVWGVFDHIPETNFPDIRNKTVINSHRDHCMLIPREGDIVRFYVHLSDSDAIDANSRRIDKSRVEPKELFEVARRAFAPYTLEEPKEYLWWTTYSVGQRVASKFSMNERVFIVGDACHTHSPKAGQGMNASMNDSHNLVWKMVYVLRGWADVSLLKTYEQERRQYAQDLIDFDRHYSKLLHDNPHPEIEDHDSKLKAFVEAFKHGDFATGIGIRYTESPIVRNKHQSTASNLVIGERVLPHLFMRAADGRPLEMQDCLPSDTRFKVLVFTGDSSNSEQQVKLNKLAEEMKGVLSAYAPSGDVYRVFDIWAISRTKKETVMYTDLPKFFRPHWSKVFVDDTDSRGRLGGGGYRLYGIDETEGAIVIVRPDGYVGTILPRDRIDELDDYLRSFMFKA